MAVKSYFLLRGKGATGHFVSPVYRYFQFLFATAANCFELFFFFKKNIPYHMGYTLEGICNNFATFSVYFNSRHCSSHTQYSSLEHVLHKVLQFIIICHLKSDCITQLRITHERCLNRAPQPIPLKAPLCINRYNVLLGNPYPPSFCEQHNCHWYKSKVFVTLTPNLFEYYKHNKVIMTCKLVSWKWTCTLRSYPQRYYPLIQVTKCIKTQSGYRMIDIKKLFITNQCTIKMIQKLFFNIIKYE